MEEIVHGSIVYRRDGWIGFAIGIPTPSGYATFIPKYRPCSNGPWRRASGMYCRVLKEYGPRGISEVMGYTRLIYDPIYNSYMPYISIDETVLIRDPWTSLSDTVRSGSWPPLIHVMERIRSAGLSVSDFGVTGSTAAGIQVPGLSDVDLVYKGSVTRLMEAWHYIVDSRYNVAARDHAGIRVEPGIDLGWRRGYVNKTHVSWTGVEGRCRYMTSYERIDTPRSLFKGEVYVEGGQETALVYPPCVESREGVVVVSYEYNVGALLYRGGRLRIEGIAGEYTVYIGSREKPGSITAL